MKVYLVLREGEKATAEGFSHSLGFVEYEDAAMCAKQCNEDIGEGFFVEEIEVA